MHAQCKEYQQYRNTYVKGKNSSFFHCLALPRDICSWEHTVYPFRHFLCIGKICVIYIMEFIRKQLLKLGSILTYFSELFLFIVFHLIISDFSTSYLSNLLLLSSTCVYTLYIYRYVAIHSLQRVWVFNHFSVDEHLRSS